MNGNYLGDVTKGEHIVRLFSLPISFINFTLLSVKFLLLSKSLPSEVIIHSCFGSYFQVYFNNFFDLIKLYEGFFLTLDFVVLVLSLRDVRGRSGMASCSVSTLFCRMLLVLGKLSSSFSLISYCRFSLFSFEFVRLRMLDASCSFQALVFTIVLIKHAD